ncbi:hypothetical protein NMA510612_1867 [Neisseria meningitidis]|uniref:Uncharacterized protein n=1 Tax=Neisseria meningitidis TaxID=487 RepID=X5EKE8_NEIME|nr:hypothetical protein NMA510612_1867 [Neisseria meningitidis]
MLRAIWKHRLNFKMPSENSGDVRQASLPQNARTAQSQRSAQRKGRQQAGSDAKKRNPAP